MTKLEQYAETLYSVLPATTRQQIRRKMASDWPRISLGTVDNLLHWIRKNPELAGFNVGYVKRGKATDNDENRFFVINKDDPSFKFSDDQRNHTDNGYVSTISAMETLAANMGEMMETAQVHEVLKVHRDVLADMQELAVFCSRQMKRLHRIIEEKRTA